MARAQFEDATYLRPWPPGPQYALDLLYAGENCVTVEERMAFLRKFTSKKSRACIAIADTALAELIALEHQVLYELGFDLAPEFNQDIAAMTRFLVAFTNNKR